MYIRIQICQPRFEANGVLTDVCSCFGRVVAEAIISQPRLCVEVLKPLKWGGQIIVSYIIAIPSIIVNRDLGTHSF